MRVVLTFLALTLSFVLLPRTSLSNDAEIKDFIVYSVVRGLNMGNPGEVAPVDYYINMGTRHGLRNGSFLKVMRKMPSFDLIGKKLFRDVRFEIAQLKIIHLENDVAIARLEKMSPEDRTPVLHPRAILIGDLIEKL